MVKLKREIDLLLKTVDNFDFRQENYPSFVQNLGEIVFEVDIAESLKSELRSLWENLEEENAVLLDESNQNPSLDINFVTKQIEGIKNIVERIQKDSSL